MIAYAACFVLCVLVARKARRAAHRREARFWAAVGGTLLILAVDKQLQLQLWFGQIGRDLIREEGLYDERRVYQVAFVLITGTIALVAIGGLRVLAIRRRWPVVPLIATTFLVGYNLIKTASLHHIDTIINLALPGFRLNLLIELVGVLAVGISAARRLRSLGQPPPVPSVTVRRVEPASDPTRWLLDRSRKPTP